MTVLCLCQRCATSGACTRRLMPALCARTCPEAINPGGLDCAVYSCPDYAEIQNAPAEARGSALPAGCQPAEGHISDAPIIAQGGTGGKSHANG